MLISSLIENQVVVPSRVGLAHKRSCSNLSPALVLSQEWNGKLAGSLYVREPELLRCACVHMCDCAGPFMHTWNPEGGVRTPPVTLLLLLVTGSH